MKQMVYSVVTRQILLVFFVVAAHTGARADETMTTPAPCCGFTPAVTANQYAGRVQITASGNVFFAPPDSFYDPLYGNTLSGQIQGPPSPLRIARFSAGTPCTCALECAGRNFPASDLLVGAYPAYNPLHTYTVVLDLGAVPDRLAFGIPDCGCSDNVGAWTIGIAQVMPSLSIDDVAMAEGNSGTVNAVFTVSLSAASGQTVTVNFATANGTATAGSDYLTNFGVVTFNPGETSKTIAVVVNGDAAIEGDETFFVNLTSANNASIADGEGVGTIVNDDVLWALGNLSSRSRVLTGDNQMIGGFIIDGMASMRVLVRARGPSMSGAPFFVPGTLANPLLRLFSGQTLIAENDNWQTPPVCFDFPCEGATQIVSTGLDPCQPNPGQAAPPPNCAQESAILITLPPGGYTGIVTGADGGTGVGLVEVFDADASTLSELSNISTRGFVQTGDNIMIGGLIIEATAPKTVLIRGRGPSMSGAPFNLSGTLANPLLQLFSGQTVIAFNDNWRDLQEDEIVATGIDPCLPNPGQAAAPPGCDQESAMVLDLPAGGYTAWLSGVGGQTGIGLVEVFEVPDVIVPIVLGNYVGSATVTLSQCTNPANNQVNNFFSAVNISSQNGSIIGGTGTFSGPTSGSLNISGTVTAGFDTMGSFTFTQPGASGSGTFTGASIGNTMTLNLNGQVIISSGGICALNGAASGNR